MTVVTLKTGAKAEVRADLPPEEGKYGVRVHTPDRHGYTKGATYAGNRIVIPRSRPGDGGLSEGFSPEPGVVSVEPTNLDTGEGGTLVDTANITPALSQRAFALASQQTSNNEERIIQAYKLLGAASPKIVSVGSVEPRPTTNHLMSGYVVPPSTLNGSQLTKELPMSRVPPRVGQSSAPPMPIQPEPLYMPPTQQPQPDNTMLLMLLQQQQQMTSWMKDMQEHLLNHKQEKVIPVVDPKTEEEEQMKVMEQVVAEEKKKPDPEKTYTRDQVQEVVENAFKSLGIPRLGAAPAKPAYQVVFDLPGAGKISAWYHWVGQHDNGLFLIYDTRYEYGQQYLPPDLGPGKAIRIELPQHDKHYTCYSTGFVHPFGKLLIVNLVLAKSVSNKPQAGWNDNGDEEAVTPEGGPVTMSLGDLLDGVSDR